MRNTLVGQAKGNPTPLIHKAKGHGTAPHFKGRMQTAALEKAVMVSIEVYACVACMYSTTTMDTIETKEAAKTAKTATSIDAHHC
jgi:hypothetical protein